MPVRWLPIKLLWSALCALALASPSSAAAGDVPSASTIGTASGSATSSGGGGTSGISGREARLLATLPATLPAGSADGAESSLAVSVADYGAVPDSEVDSCLAFNKTIDAARASNATILRIPRGTYHFYWHSCGQWAPDIYVSNTVVTPLPPKPIGLWLHGLTGLVVEGGDSLLLMHGLMTPIAVDHSHNISIRNLAVDFPHPSVVEALVTAASADGKSFELKVHGANNVSVSDGNVTFGSLGEGWTLSGVTGLSPVAQSDHAGTLCQEFDPMSDITWRRGNPLAGATVAALGDGQSLRLTFKTKQRELPQAGHHLWFRDGGRPNAGVLTQYSSSVTYTNVAMHFMSGFGIVAQYTRGLSFSNVSAETAAGSGRHCSCSADLLHFSGCAGLINVTGGRFVGAQDDGVNVHGTHLQIVTQISERNIVVQFMQAGSYGFDAFFAGDKVQFTRSDTLESFGIGIVKSAQMLSAKGCLADPEYVLPCQIALELEAPLVGARLHMDVVENLAYTADFSISGAYFSRIPTRGLLVTTRGKVRIHNNTIHTPLRPALHIADDAASWFESGPTADVIFDGNIVIRKHNHSRPLNHGDSPPVDVKPSNTENATVHRNLRVTNNELHLHQGSKLEVVAAKSLAGLTLTGNRIYSPGRPLAPAEMVSSVNSSGIVVKDNTVITTTAGPMQGDDTTAASSVPTPGGMMAAVVKTTDPAARLAPPRTLMWDGEALLHGRAAVASRSASVTAAVALLRKDAAAAFLVKPLSVTSKKAPPAGGDLHDYVSYESYGWPCTAICNVSLFKNCSKWKHSADHCNRSTGLPWQVHDGYNDPESAQDRPRLSLMFQSVEALSASAFFFNNTEHAQHAALLLRTWFLNSDTFMRPNARFAQSKNPEEKSRSGGGIIDFSDGAYPGGGGNYIASISLAHMLDSVAMLACLDEGISSFYPPILVYMENPYMDNK